MNDLVLRLKDASPANFTTAEMRALEHALREAVAVLHWSALFAGLSRERAIEIRAILSDHRLNALCRVLNAGRERAEGGQIMREIALLLGAFPASAAPDPKIYAEMMIDEITARSPSLLALKRTCARLRRTFNWPPSISEVMEALSREEAELWDQCHLVSSERIAEVTKLIKTKLKELDAKIAELETELRFALEVEAEGHAARPSSAELRHAVKRLKGEDKTALAPSEPS